MVTILVLSLIGAFFYGQIGYQTARKSLDVWDKKDNGSPVAFLLYPTCFRRGTVGKKGESAVSEVFDADEWEKKTVRYEEGGSWTGVPAEGGRVAYIAVMLFFWPFRLCWNVPAIVIQGAFPMLKAFDKGCSPMRFLRPSEAAPEPEALPEPALKTAALPPSSSVEDLRHLLDERKAIDEKITTRQAEIRGALEVEQTVDPTFPDLEPKKHP